MRRYALLVLPGLIAGSAVAVARPAAAYTPSVKPQSVTIATTLPAHSDHTRRQIVAGR